MADFSSAATMKAVHDTLDEAMVALPPGKRGAILIDASTETKTVRALFVEKVNDHWQVALEGDYDGHHVAGKVATAVTW